MPSYSILVAIFEIANSTFKLIGNNTIINNNLDQTFKSYFLNPNSIWSISGTKIHEGPFVFSAMNDGLVTNLNKIALLSSIYLIDYGSVFLINAPYLPGHSVHFSQPHKNTTTVQPNLSFFFSGTVFGIYNNHHNFNYFFAKPIL